MKYTTYEIIKEDNMETVADQIVSMMIALEGSKEIRNAMKRVQDVYMNAGYLPTLTDWEDMSYEDKKEYLM